MIQPCLSSRMSAPRCRKLTLLLLLLFVVGSLLCDTHQLPDTCLRQFLVADAWQHLTVVTRRPMIHLLGGGTASVFLPMLRFPYSEAAAATPTTTLIASTDTTSSLSSLSSRLAQRDASLLPNRMFNLSPPNVQIYPPWLRGNWTVTSQFAGFTFPSRTLSKERIVQNVNIPGFQKCSIVPTVDIGKPQVTYNWSIDPQSGIEDRKTNLPSMIDAYLGYSAVRQVLYDPQRNPNRISIDFYDYRTVNAERIELFCNARESQEYIEETGAVATSIFVCAEYVRQVTFGTGSTVGVPRQAITNYAHFWTFRQNTATTTAAAWTGNQITAAYLDPQDPMYFDEPTKPVAVYSHTLSAQPLLSRGQ